MSITIYGASDDLVEVEGDVREEWDGGNDPTYIGTSNGCVVRVQYDDDGCWRVVPVIMPKGVSWSKVEAISADDDNYSDRLTIEGEITWIVPGDTVARA